MFTTETLSIAGYDDMPIGASLYMPESTQTKPPLVIYAHGISGFKDWGAMHKVAEAFTEAGMAYLSINFSHNGTSLQQPTEFVNLNAYAKDRCLIRQFDLTQVVNFAEQTLASRVDSNLLYLIGHSRGGTDAILFAANDKRIKKLISWAAPSEAKTPWKNWDTEKMKAWKAEGVAYRLNSRTQQELPISYSLYEEFRENKARLNVETAARSLSDTPWLIVHGDLDEGVFVKEAYDLKSWQPNARVLIIPDTGHTFGRTHPWPEEKTFPKATQILLKESISFLREA